MWGGGSYTLVTQSLVKIMKELGQGRGIVETCSSEDFLLAAVSIVPKGYSGTSYGSQGAETHPCQSGPFWHGSLQTSLSLPCVF